MLLMATTFAYSQNSEQYSVNSENLNVRSGAGTQNEIISTLSMDDVVTIIEKNENGWWLIEFQGKQGFVFSKLLKKDKYSEWEKKNYKSGVTPECENVIPKYDFELDNYLRVNIGSNTDVVVKLMEMNGSGSDECIRIVYVRSNESYEIKNVPEGKYYLKIAYGKDYRQKIVDNQCVVKFIKNAQYEKGDNILDFNKVKQPNERIGNEIYENWSLPCFELSLDIIMIEGTKSGYAANDISEEEFNN